MTDDNGLADMAMALARANPISPEEAISRLLSGMAGIGPWIESFQESSYIAFQMLEIQLTMERAGVSGVAIERAMSELRKAFIDAVE